MTTRGLPPLALWTGLLLVLGLGGVAWWWLRDSVPPGPVRGTDIGALAGLEDLSSRFPVPAEGPLEWPADHGAHAEQFVESWMFTGRLHDEAGQALAFQLLFQRLNLAPEAGERGSAWAAREAWRARFTLRPAGVAGRTEERLSRAAHGLAGSSSDPPGAWVEDWNFALAPDGRGFELQARLAAMKVSLALQAPDHAPVPVATDAAGVYRGYWWPGLVVAATLDHAEGARELRGQAFMEHLWGRAQPVGRGQLALARVWLEGVDGLAWRCEQWRRRAGGGMPQTECLAHPSAPAGEVELGPEPRGHETIAGARLPLRWSLLAPGSATPVRLVPLSGRGEAGAPGGWSGALVGDAPDQWGWLELSNFVP